MSFQDEYRKPKDISLGNNDITANMGKQKANELNRILDKKRKPAITFHYRNYDSKTQERQSLQEVIPFKSFLVQKYLSQQIGSADLQQNSKSRIERTQSNQEQQEKIRSFSSQQELESKKLPNIHRRSMNGVISQIENDNDRHNQEKRKSQGKQFEKKNIISQHYFYGNDLQTIDNDYTLANINLEIEHLKRQQSLPLKQFVELGEVTINRSIQPRYPIPVKNEQILIDQSKSNTITFNDYRNTLSSNSLEKPIPKLSEQNKAPYFQDQLLKQDFTSRIEHQIIKEFSPKYNYSNDDIDVNRRDLMNGYNQNAYGNRNQASSMINKENRGIYGYSPSVRSSTSTERQISLSNQNKLRGSFNEAYQIDHKLIQPDQSNLIEFNYYSAKNQRPIKGSQQQSKNTRCYTNY